MGYFDSEKPAKVTKEMRSQVNWEFYYFADAAGKKRFDADPLKWCGVVTDPISRARFRPTNQSRRVDHNGIPYFFESKDTQTTFTSDPDSFSVIYQPMFEAPSRKPTGETRSD